MKRSGRRAPILVSAVVIFLIGLSLASCFRAGTPPREDEQDPGAAGVKPPRTLTFVLDTEVSREDEAREIARQLNAYGLEVEVKVWNQTLLEAEIRQGTRQAYLTSWSSAFYDPFDLAVPKLRTGEVGNFSFYSNPEFDRLMTAAVTTADAALRTDYYHRAQVILKDDAPWIFGYYKKVVDAASARVVNWYPRPDGRVYAADLDLEPDEETPGVESTDLDERPDADKAANVEEPGSEGKTLTVALPTDRILTLDPTDYRDRETETVIRNLFDGLVNRTPYGKVVPEIATGWDIDNDGATYTFYLRDDVTFHNGTRLTADDVVFTFEKVYGLGEFKEPTSRAGLVLPEGGDQVQVVKLDDYTVRFRFSRPFPVFLQGLVHVQILPAAYYKQVGAGVFQRRPVGTGSFRFAGGDLDGEIVLERYPGYYGGSPDLPPVGPSRLERVRFLMMADGSARVEALKKGVVDLIQQVPRAFVEELQADDRFKVKFAEGTTSYEVELNNTQPPFDDVRVRRALNHAINWEVILQKIHGGMASRLPTAFLPNGWGYNAKLAPYEYHPARAVQLLEEAGYSVHLPANAGGS